LGTAITNPNYTLKEIKRISRLPVCYLNAWKLSKTYCVITSVTPAENSTGIIICYTCFRTINFPSFLPYCFPVLNVIERYVEANVYAISHE
jgi:hypothetical protein